MDTELTEQDKALIDEYRKKMEQAKTPEEKAQLAATLGCLLNCPLPQDFPS